MHIKSVEDELKGTIGKALGKQGDKILRAIQNMEAELQRYHELCALHKLSHAHNDCHRPDIVASAVKYNQHRQAALTARCELTVHRQAAGFIVNNHKYVTDQYPIAEALPVVPTTDTDTQKEQQQQTEATTGEPTKKFTGQLDWWERVGRWR